MIPMLETDEIRLVLEKVSEGDPDKNFVPAYHFAICDLKGIKMGACDLRIGHNDRLYYGGNIGFRIEEPYRGHNYAEKACRLLFSIAHDHGLGYVIITCDPENMASRRTCEKLGGELVEIAELPEDNDMRQSGITRVCVFRYELNDRMPETEPVLFKIETAMNSALQKQAVRAVSCRVQPFRQWMPVLLLVISGVLLFCVSGRISSLALLLLGVYEALRITVLVPRKHGQVFEERTKLRENPPYCEMLFFEEQWGEIDHALETTDVYPYSRLYCVLETKDLLLFHVDSGFYKALKNNFTVGEKDALLAFIREKNPKVKLMTCKRYKST